MKVEIIEVYQTVRCHNVRSLKSTYAGNAYFWILLPVRKIYFLGPYELWNEKGSELRGYYREVK